jgi:hypothetical protein
MQMRVGWCAAVVTVAIAASGCHDKYKAGGELHGREVVLRREVEGLRVLAARLERHEPMLPAGDAIVAIDDTLVRDMIRAQLPLDADVEGYHLRLERVDVSFRGSPVVRLQGTLHPLRQPSLEAEVEVIGALEQIEVVPGQSTLKSRIAIDHLGIAKAAGLESYLRGSTLDEVARELRIQIKDRIPVVQIPVNVQQVIALPAVTRGPARIDGAMLPLKAAVSQVVAVRGRLWIAVHFEPGVVTKTADAPDVADASTAGAGVSFADDEAAGTAARSSGHKGK